MYIEPEEYFTESARKILLKGEKKSSQKKDKKLSTKNKKLKATKIIIDDK